MNADKKICVHLRSSATMTLSGAPGGRKSGFVIRVIRDFFDVLGVADLILGVQNENRAAFDAQLFDQRAVILSEGGILVVGEHLHPIHTERAAPALLR